LKSYSALKFVRFSLDHPVYKRKLGFAALAFVDAEVNADREISGRELQKRLQENYTLTFQSA